MLEQLDLNCLWQEGRMMNIMILIFRRFLNICGAGRFISTILQIMVYITLYFIGGEDCLLAVYVTVHHISRPSFLPMNQLVYVIQSDSYAHCRVRINYEASGSCVFPGCIRQEVLCKHLVLIWYWALAGLQSFEVRLIRGQCWAANMCESDTVSMTACKHVVLIWY